MISFELMVNSLESFMIIGFITLYFGMKDIGLKKYAVFIVTVAVDMCLTTLLNLNFLYEGFLSLIYIALYIFYAHWFLKGDLYTKIFISAMTDCVIYGSSTFISFFWYFLFNYTFGAFAQFSVLRVVRITVVHIVYAAIYGLMLRFKVKNPPSKIMAITLIAISVMSQIGFNSITNIFAENEALSSQLVIICGTMILILALMYYIIRKMNIDEALKIENLLLKQNIELNIERSTATLDTYNKLHSLRHELITHFNNVIAYIKEDPQKAIEYMESVSGQTLSVPTVFIETGNKCLDTLISSKISECHKEGIKTSVKIMDGSLNIFSDEEVTIIFANLFNNAIRAAKDSAEKKIDLNVLKDGAELLISMSNSVKEHSLDVNPDLKTTKANKEEHGFGIKNIKKIIKNHNGTIRFSEKDNVFRFYIMINKGKTSQK